MAKPPPSTNLDSLARDFIEAGMNEQAAQILVAALPLFAEKGYAATTVREIVRAADVTNPMLYYYFDSKKGVFLALMNVLIDSMAETVEEVLDEYDDIEARLRAVAQAHFDACGNAPEVLRFVYSVLFGPVRSRPTYDVACTYQTIHHLVTQALTDAIDSGQFQPRSMFSPQQLTEQFMGLINLHLMNVLTLYEQSETQSGFDESSEEYLGEEALNGMLEFYFHGAGTLATEKS